MYNSSLGIGFNKIVNLRVNRLTIQETGTYNQQYLRPWQTCVDYQVQNAVSQLVGGMQSNHLRPEAVSPLANAFLQKQASPQGTINVPNGWNERRIRFMLEVQYEFQVGGTNKTYFLGYTDHPGVSMQGSVDPRMVFYVNSYVCTRVLESLTPMGMMTMESAYDSKQILHGATDRSISNPSSTFGMRPQDLYRYFNNDLELLNIGAGMEGAKMFDTRVNISPNGSLADRRNNIPSHYSCNVFNNLLSVSDRLNMGENQPAMINNVIRGMECNTDSLTQQPLFAALTNCRDNFRVGASFTFTELERVDPNLHNVTNYIVMDSHGRAGIHHAGQTSGWQGTDIVTRAAATLAHSVPALMMENMITRIVMKSSNYEIGGRMTTQIIHGNGFSNCDMRANYDSFRNNFEALVLSQLTYNNSLTYALEMNVDLLGESWIKITIDNSPVVDYVTPSFADSLFSPLVSDNANSVAEVANDFKVLYDTITESSYSNAYTPPTGNIFTTSV